MSGEKDTSLLDRGIWTEIPSSQMSEGCDRSHDCIHGLSGRLCICICIDTVFFFSFPFCAWLLAESQRFNQQQAQLASVGKPWFDAGPVVWLRIVRPLESKKKAFILMCILFSCVRQASTIWIFEGMLSLSVFVGLVVAEMKAVLIYFDNKADLAAFF